MKYFLKVPCTGRIAFATLILVSGDSRIRERLEKTCESFQKRQGLTVIIKPARTRPAGTQTPVLPYTLQATALDHAGIVHRVTHLLRQKSINIASAHTHNTPAPFTGTAVFHFRMTIEIPSTVSLPRLREDLNRLGEEQNIDIILTPLEEE